MLLAAETEWHTGWSIAGLFDGEFSRGENNKRFERLFDEAHLTITVARNQSKTISELSYLANIHSANGMAKRRGNFHGFCLQIIAAFKTSNSLYRRSFMSEPIKDKPPAGKTGVYLVLSRQRGIGPPEHGLNAPPLLIVPIFLQKRTVDCSANADRAASANGTGEPAIIPGGALS